MLKAEVSRRRKAFTLLNDLVWFVAGAAWVFSDTALPSLLEHDVSHGRAILESIFGFSMMALTALSLVHDWCFRRIHTRYRANSRTLAIIRAGHRTAYIKRADVVATAHGGRTLLLADGSRHSLSTPWGDIGGRFENQFLKPLYDLWWPTCPLHRVRRVLGERAPTSAHMFFLILCAWAPFIPHLFLDSATHAWLFPATVSVFVFVVVLILIFVVVFRFVAEARAILFRFDDPEGQENWDLMPSSTSRGQEKTER